MQLNWKNAELQKLERTENLSCKEQNYAVISIRNSQNYELELIIRKILEIDLFYKYSFD